MSTALRVARLWQQSYRRGCQSRISLYVGVCSFVRFSRFQTYRFAAHKSSCTSLLLVRGMIASGSGDESIALWTRSGQDYVLAKRMCGHKGYISSMLVRMQVDAALLAPQSEGALLFSASYDHTIGLWHLEVRGWPDDLLTVAARHPGEINHCARRLRESPGADVYLFSSRVEA